MDVWADIEYRDFWDVLRVFIFSADGRKFLADCTFDEATEAYSGHYIVYELSPDFETPAGSWYGLSELALKRLGALPVEEVRFDETKRKAVSTRLFQVFA